MARRTRISKYNEEAKLAYFNIVMGVVIVVITIVAFVSPIKNLVLFPFIFIFATITNFINIRFMLNLSSKKVYENVPLLTRIVFSIILLIATIYSVFTIW